MPEQDVWQSIERRFVIYTTRAEFRAWTYATGTEFLAFPLRRFGQAWGYREDQERGRFILILGELDPLIEVTMVPEEGGALGVVLRSPTPAVDGRMLDCLRDVALARFGRPGADEPAAGGRTGKRTRKTIVERRKRVEELYREGLTASAMAETLFCGESTVRRDCKKLGLRLR